MNVVTYLDTAAIIIEALTDLLDVPVSGSVPQDRPDTFVTVRRVGGPRLNLVADDATLTVEAWAESDTEANTLAEQASAAIRSLRGSSLDGVAVYRITEPSGPVELPDPVSEQHRSTFTVTVALRGESQTDGS